MRRPCQAASATPYHSRSRRRTRSANDFHKLLQETDGADDPQRWYTFTTEEYGDLISQYDGSDTLYHQYDGVGAEGRESASNGQPNGGRPVGTSPRSCTTRPTLNS